MKGHNATSSGFTLASAWSGFRRRQAGGFRAKSRLLYPAGKKGQRQPQDASLSRHRAKRRVQDDKRSKRGYRNPDSALASELGENSNPRQTRVIHGTAAQPQQASERPPGQPPRRAEGARGRRTHRWLCWCCDSLGFFRFDCSPVQLDSHRARLGPGGTIFPVEAAFLRRLRIPSPVAFPARAASSCAEPDSDRSTIATARHRGFRQSSEPTPGARAEGPGAKQQPAGASVRMA